MATVSQIVQDNKGFIWLAGQGGLTRFDGSQPITFSSNNSAWPLSVNWLHDVTVDNDHLLIASETDGLWRFNPESGQAEKVLTEIARESHYSVVSFQNSYYIYAPDKLYRYQVNSNTTEVIDNKIKIKKIAHTSKHLYVSNQSGLYQLKNNTLTKVLNDPIVALTALTSSVIAITKTSVTRFNDDGSQFSIKKPNSIYAVTKEFNTNNFFSVTNQGVINKFSGETLQPMPHKFENIRPIRVKSFLHDSSGVLWFISNRGVEQVTENSIKNNPKVFDIKINANMLAFFKSNLIIGSYGAGLQNFTTNVFPSSVNDAFSEGGLRVTDIATFNEELYIATFDGVWRYDNGTNKVSKLTFSNNNKLILTMKHKDGFLYIGTNYNGMYIYDIKNNTIVNHISSMDGLSSAEVIDMLPLNNGSTWLATATGIDIVTNNNVKNLSLSTPSKVVSLLEADNKIFAATLGSGIYAFNKQGILLAQFGQGNRFSQMILVNDEVWISARPGLYRFNPTNYQLSMVENTEQYSFVGSNILHENTIYASHYGGVLSLDLTVKEQFNPRVYISKTTISGKSYLLNKTMSIESGNDVITLDLASLDYRPGVPKQFRYRLNDNNWNQINGSQLTLTGLASGAYNIEIMATNSLGQWSDFKAYTEINVEYPWYWSLQIRLLYGVFLVCLISLTIWLLYLRSKSIVHVHGILKNGINNYGKINLQVKRNLSLVKTLINQGKIEESKPLITQCINELSSHQTSPEPNTLDGKTLSVALPFFANYLKHKYQVNLNYQLNVQDDSFSYELQADLYRVIFEAITCVVLKGNGRNFKVLLQVFKYKIWLNVYDDEGGFINFDSKINFDISMYYIRQIANKHNGSINTFNEQGDGSQLVLSLPFNRDSD